MPELDKMLVRDVFKYQDSISREELGLERSRYEYVLGRRDQINDKIRNGSIAINAVSLLGVVTALGTDVVSTGQFGLTPSDLARSASFFIGGLILAVIGLAGESWRLLGEAATQYDRVQRQLRQRAALDSDLSEENAARLREAMDAIAELPPGEFGTSILSILATNAAAGAWFGGMLLPLWRLITMVQ